MIDAIDAAKCRLAAARVAGACLLLTASVVGCDDEDLRSSEYYDVCVIQYDQQVCVDGRAEESRKDYLDYCVDMYERHPGNDGDACFDAMMAWYRCSEKLSCEQFKNTELPDDENPCLVEQQGIFETC